LCRAQPACTQQAGSGRSSFTRCLLYQHNWPQVEVQARNQSDMLIHQQAARLVREERWRTAVAGALTTAAVGA
jgi:hypothetical protein